MRTIAFVVAALLATLFVYPAQAQEGEAGECAAVLRAAERGEPVQSLNTLKMCQEIDKLHAEVLGLRFTNNSLNGPLGFLIPWSGFITGLMALIVSIAIPAIGVIIRNTLNNRARDRLHQERVLKREAHNLELMQGLAADTKTYRFAAAASLLRRYEEIAAEGEVTPELKTIGDVVLSFVRNKDSDADVAKYMADQFVRAIGLQDDSVRREQEARPGPATARKPSVGRLGLQLRDYDMQYANLQNVFWAGVNAPEVDFYRANFTRASLRDSWLSKCTFKKAIFTRAVLRRADLRDCDLREAAMTGCDLQGAVLKGADFSGADLTDALLDPSVLRDPDSEAVRATHRTDARNANFSGAILANARFNRAQLNGAQFYGADLSGADFTGATGLDSALFNAAAKWSEATKWPDERRPGAGYALSAPEPVSA